MEKKVISIFLFKNQGQQKYEKKQIPKNRDNSKYVYKTTQAHENVIFSTLFQGYWQMLFTDILNCE